MTKNWKTIAIIVVIAAVSIPIFKSGGKTSMTLVEFIKNHTIWHDKDEPLYVPKEDYLA